jgi:hypothetical protein
LSRLEVDGGDGGDGGDDFVGTVINGGGLE